MVVFGWPSAMSVLPIGSATSKTVHTEELIDAER